MKETRKGEDKKWKGIRITEDKIKKEKVSNGTRRRDTKERQLIVIITTNNSKLMCK
jgi:hypothetical protein